MKEWICSGCCVVGWGARMGIETCTLSPAWKAMILSRCHTVKVSKNVHCAVWQGPMQGNTPRFYPDKKSLELRAVIYLLEHGRQAHVPKARYRCLHGTANCCMPGHVIQVTIEAEIRARMLDWCAQPINRKLRSVSARACVVAGRRHQKIQPSQVPAILADERPQHVIAADYGVTQSAVSMIKSGKRWGATNRYLQIASNVHGPP